MSELTINEKDQDNIALALYNSICSIVSLGKRYFCVGKSLSNNQCFHYHHIKPKSLYPELATRYSNLIPVPPTLHAVLHCFLKTAYKFAGETDIANKFNVAANIIKYANEHSQFRIDNNKVVLDYNAEIMKPIIKKYYKCETETKHAVEKLYIFANSYGLDIWRYKNSHNLIAAVKRKISSNKINSDVLEQLKHRLVDVENAFCKLLMETEQNVLKAL